MDPTALLPIVTPVVTAVATFLGTTVGVKAAEKVGERAGEGIAGTGERALQRIRAWFSDTGDAKARKALADVEADPKDSDYIAKLAKETARVAALHPPFTDELKTLSQQLTIAHPGSTVQHNTVNSNSGVIGVVHGSVTFQGTNS